MAGRQLRLVSVADVVGEITAHAPTEQQMITLAEATPSQTNPARSTRRETTQATLAAMAASKWRRRSYYSTTTGSNRR